MNMQVPNISKQSLKPIFSGLGNAALNYSLFNILNPLPPNICKNSKSFFIIKMSGRFKIIQIGL